MPRPFHMMCITAVLTSLILFSCQKNESLLNSTQIAQLEKEAHDAAEGMASDDAQHILQDQMNTDDTQGFAKAFQLDPSLKHLDPKKEVPKKSFESALSFFQTYRSKFKNQNYLAIIDFKQKNTNKRFYLINLKTGLVEKFLVAHGKYSDVDFDGYATSFSNVEGSGKSSLGAYMTAEYYTGKHGLSMRLDGLQSTNSNARARAVVMHQANYVSPYLNPIGRSLGCPAVEPKYRDYLMKTLKAGALLFTSY